MVTEKEMQDFAKINKHFKFFDLDKITILEMTIDHYSSMHKEFQVKAAKAEVKTEAKSESNNQIVTIDYDQRIEQEDPKVARRMGIDESDIDDCFYQDVYLYINYKNGDYNLDIGASIEDNDGWYFSGDIKDSKQEFLDKLKELPDFVNHAAIIKLLNMERYVYN
jgi:hypothetical protein